MSARGPGYGLGAALLAVLIWGGQLPIAKGAFAALDSWSITLVRYGPAALVFLPLLAWTEGRGGFAMRRGQAWLVIGSGIAMGASALLTFTGLSLTRPEIAVLILGLQPAMTAVIDWLIWRRRAPAFTLGCLVFAFLGVGIAVTHGGALLLHPTPRAAGEASGNVLIACGALAWVSYVLLSSRLRGWSTMRVSALTSLPALAIVLLVWAAAGWSGATYVESALLPAASWRLAYVSLLGVVAAMFLWNFGVGRIGALNAMLLLNLMPVITFGVRAMEGASFAASELFGAAVVIGALMANNVYLRRQYARATA